MTRHGYRAQIFEEVRMTLENGERLLVSFGIPLALLVFFSKVDVISTGTSSRIGFVAPGILCLAVMSTAMVSLAIATGFERSYGVLRRLGTTPLGRSGIVLSKIVSVVVVELIQAVVIVAVSYGLGWHPSGRIAIAVLAIVIGTIAFGGLGLLMAGTLRAEMTLATTNALYITLLLIGGVIFPLSKLGSFAAFARVLPTDCLSNIVRASVTSYAGQSVESWIALSCWAIALPLLARWRFRFE